MATEPVNPNVYIQYCLNWEQMYQGARYKGLGLLLSLFLVLSLPPLAMADNDEPFSGGEGILPGFSNIFWNDDYNPEAEQTRKNTPGIFQDTDYFTAFGLLFFVVLFGVETTFGSFYEQAKWINVGIAFFIAAYAWTRFASTLIKIARFFDWFAIVGIIILIFASAQKAHSAEAGQLGRSD